MKFNDGVFEYQLQIIGEDGSVKTIQDNRQVAMKDVEIYSLRLLKKDLQKDSPYIPYAQISIDGKDMGCFVLNEPKTEIDRFPTSGDVLCFAVCSTDDIKFRRQQHRGLHLQRSPPAAFQNVTAEKIGLITVEFGFCLQRNFADARVHNHAQQTAYYKLQTVDLPEPCKITSRDVQPLLEDLNLQRKKQSGYDETDCGTTRMKTVEGGTLRVGNRNTLNIAERMFTTCGMDDQMHTNSVSIRLVGTSPSQQQRVADGKNLNLKDIYGTTLSSCHYLAEQFPPKADLTYN